MPLVAAGMRANLPLLRRRGGLGMDRSLGSWFRAGSGQLSSNLGALGAICPFRSGFELALGAIRVAILAPSERSKALTTAKGEQ